MKRIVCVTVALLTSLPAVGQPVCRPTALGSVGCLGAVVPPPAPRELLGDDRQGLDAVLERIPPEAGLQELVPPRRTNAFGDTRLRPGEAGATGGPCRRSALGNLRCR